MRIIPPRLEAATLAALALAPGALAAEGHPYKAEAGPLAVEVAQARFDDAARGRELPARVYAPSEGDGLPLVVFSHGFGETMATYAHLATHWASYGYAVIVPNHAGTDREAMLGVRAGKPPAPVPFSARPADLSHIVDVLAAGEGPDLVRGRIDLGRVGAGGHSMGSTTALVTIGMTMAGEGARASYADPRFRCAVAMSVQIGSAAGKTGEASAAALERGIDADSWSAIEKPAMVMMGTKDRGYGVLAKDPGLRRVSYDRMPPGEKYLVNLVGAQHHAFTDTDPWYGGDARDPRHYALVFQATTAFYDACLRDDAQARAWLHDLTLAKDNAGLVEMEWK
ncbi:MAG: alpha/beta hydrolase [Alphaproteobacteria bacterium]|nr:alpha/beta hydrolase [Alphaproteobacteria bacterium]